MSDAPAPNRSRWPIIIVILSLVVLVVTFAVGVHYSSTGGGTSDDVLPTSVDSLDVTIDIVDYKYHPADISVPRGAKVTWINNDKAPHTATERNSQWDTTVISENEGAYIVFSRPGAYDYYCTIHPYMTGKITVR